MKERSKKTSRRTKKLHFVVVHVWDDGSSYSFARDVDMSQNLRQLFGWEARGDGSGKTEAVYACATRAEAEDLARTWNGADEQEGRLHDFETDTAVAVA